VFARALLEQRKEGNLPPYVHFLLLRAEGSLRELPLHFLEEARKLALKFGSRDLHFFGPMVSPLGKKAGQFRAQLIIQASKRSSLHRMGKQLILALSTLPQGKKVRWHMDVDPIDFT
jgi:primosomal protein N' (replication factor Y)